MSDMRTTWQGVKKDIGKSKNDQAKALLKTFTKGLGKALDKVADAYKKKDDEKVKLTAAAALKIVKIYKNNVNAVYSLLPMEVTRDVSFLEVIHMNLAKLAKEGLEAEDSI